LARERKTGFPVVDHHKVVARGLIFIEMNFHRSFACCVGEGCVEEDYFISS
jgi:hypothetical protein